MMRREVLPVHGSIQYPSTLEIHYWPMRVAKAAPKGELLDDKTGQMLITW
jgi:hypothetical protein